MRASRLPLTLILVACLTGCVSTDLRGFKTRLTADGMQPDEVSALPVSDGQLIVSENSTAASLMVSLIAERFARYTHVGIIVFDEGRPYVYESMGTFIPMPWRPPNAGMKGGVRRVPLAEFIERANTIGIYHPAEGVDRQALIEFARAREREGRPFDGFYDPHDDSRYYCVEFVVRAMEAAGGRAPDPAPVSRNASLHVALDWLRIRTPALLLAGDLVEEQRRVVLLSRQFTAEQVDRYFALKEELHRRFTPDQRLGHLFQWHRGLELRPDVDRFTDEAMRSSESPRQFADRILGEVAASPVPVDELGAGIGDHEGPSLVAGEQSAVEE